MELSSYSAVFGRCLVAAYFVYAGVSYARDWQSVVARMREMKILLPTICLWLTIFAYVIGGLAMFIGYEANVVGSVFIVILLLANAMYRRFWTLKGAERKRVLNAFMMNLALIGALVLVVVSGR